MAFDDRCAEQYGQIRAELAQTGTPIGPNDLLVAAIARAYDLTLVTHNVVEFDTYRNVKNPLFSRTFLFPYCRAAEADAGGLVGGRASDYNLHFSA